MSAREEALVLLRERFGASWMPSIIFDDVLANVRLGWRCDMHHIATGATFQGTYDGESELAAARACIAAWDEATKDVRAVVVASARKIASEAIDGMEDAAHRAVDMTGAALAAERQLADRLAEALADCGEHQRGCPWAGFEAGRPTDSGGYEIQYAGKWYEVKPNDLRPACTCGLNEALAAHAERRKA